MDTKLLMDNNKDEEPIFWAAEYVMNLDHDQFLLARAQLSEIYDGLVMTSFQSNPVQFLVRLDNIRTTAISHDFIAVAEIVSAFEAALNNAMRRGEAQSEVDSFLEILKDAIGCSSHNPQIAESLLASVAIRFGQ